MVYLIGGSPRGGKSFLSRKLSQKLNIPYISTDNLRLVVMPYFTGRDKYKNFPFEKMFDLSAIDKYFKNYTGRDMLKADIKEAKTICPGVKSLVHHLLACKMDYIIEGVHLLPSLIQSFKSNKNVRIVFLTKLDENKILNGLVQNKNNNDWITSNVKEAKTISMAAKSLCVYGRFFVAETRKHGFKCFNTEDDFLDKINRAVKYLEG